MTSTGGPVLDDQARALEEAAGLFRRQDVATLAVEGADRIDYLHRMLTQDIASLAPWRAAYACLLSIKGRILGDLLLWRAGDALLLEMAEGALPAVRPTLERHVIADDVRFGDVSAPRSRLALAGPAGPDALAAAGFEVPAAGTIVEVDGGGGPVCLLRFDRRGLPCFELAGPAAATGPLERRLLETGIVTACDPRAWDVICVHRVVPVFGRELGEDVLFNEAALEEAVSWSKGCFPGQEPVLKAKHRGQTPRRLVKMALDTPRRPQPRTALLYEGQAVGHVTSFAPALGDWGPAALAYVRRAHADPGTDLEIDGGGVARIVA